MPYDSPSFFFSFDKTMTKLYFLLLLLLSISLSSCNESKHYTIEGSTSCKQIEGEWLYSVPLSGATREAVDSAQVINGQFRLEGVADTVGLRVLRPRAILRLFVQELLVVAEPGVIRVQLDSISSGGGTPLNEQLQQWKEKKQQQDEAMNFIRQSLKECNPTDSLKIGEYKCGLLASWKEYNLNFVKINNANVVGKFVCTISPAMFNE